MASTKENNLDTSRVPVYRIFKSNIRERVRLFSTLIVENSNPSNGNFIKRKHCDLTELSIKTENFSEEGSNSQEDVKPFEDSDTNGDNKAAVMLEIDPLGINTTDQRKRPKLEASHLVTESPSFNANPPSTAAIQEEEKKTETTAEGIQNKLMEKITKSATVNKK